MNVGGMLWESSKCFQQSGVALMKRHPIFSPTNPLEFLGILKGKMNDRNQFSSNFQAVNSYVYKYIHTALL